MFNNKGDNKLYEGVRTRVLKPTNVELAPPNVGIFLKCISGAAEYHISDQVCMFLVQFMQFLVLGFDAMINIERSTI